MSCWLQRLRIDPFLLVLILVVLLASLFPCQGTAKALFSHLTTAAIALLFFMHGAKLSREAIVAGMGHWRLHLLVFLSTFALFPLLGVALGVVVPALMSPVILLRLPLSVCLASDRTIGDRLHLDGWGERGRRRL